MAKKLFGRLRVAVIAIDCHGGSHKDSPRLSRRKFALVIIYDLQSHGPDGLADAVAMLSPVLWLDNCDLAAVSRGVGFIDLGRYFFHHRSGKRRREMSGRDSHKAQGRFVEMIQARIAQQALTYCGDDNCIGDSFSLDGANEP